MLPSQPFGRVLRRALGLRRNEPRAAEKRLLVAGLGNYPSLGTRHSVGMAVLNHLAAKLNVADQWKRDRWCCADVALAKLGEMEIVLMKPCKLMNVNGLSVFRAVEMYNLSVGDIYLIHDDLDKPLGKIALKLGGSARGHNGVRSCISSLRSDQMVRLRIGIGRPASKLAVDRYVLSAFTGMEQEVLPHVFENAAKVLFEHIQQSKSSQEPPVACEGTHKAPPKTEGTEPS